MCLHISLLSVLHCLIILTKKKLTELIEQTFKRGGSLYFTCNEKRTFFTSEHPKDFNCGHVRKFVTLFFFYWTIYFEDLAQNGIDKL